MSKQDDRHLLRLIQGELSPTEEGELRRRLVADPVLMERLRSLEETWSSLDLGPADEAGLGFATRVRARAEGGVAPTARPGALPGWPSTAVAASLVAASLVVGIAGGVTAGLGVFGRGDSAPAWPEDTELFVARGDDLSEGFQWVLEEAGRAERDRPSEPPIRDGEARR